MKAIFLTTSFPRYKEDDTSVFLKYLASSLTAEKINIEVVVPQDSVFPLRYDAFEDFPVRTFRYGIFTQGKLAFGAGLLPTIKQYPQRVLQLPMFCWRMFQAGYVASADAQVIHAHWILSAGVGVLISRLRCIPLVITIHGSEMLLLRHWFFSRIFHWILNHADFVVTVSNGFKKSLIEKFPKLNSKVTCIAFGSDHFTGKQATDLIPEFESIFEGAITILAVGTLGPRKNQKELLRILSHRELSNARMIFCGKTEDAGYVEQIRAFSQELGVSSRVFIIGAQPPETVSALLSRCSLFVSASTFEGRPIALLEAMASGCLAFVSNIPSHAEVIEDQMNGYLFELKSGDIGEMAADILLRKKNVDVRSKAVESIKGLTWDLCASEYNKLYNTVYQGRASGLNAA